MDEFRYSTRAQQVIFGAGAFGRLSGAIEPLRLRRVLLITSGSYRRNGRVAAVETALGDRLAAVYDRVQSHVPDFQVEEALSMAVEREIDGVIALGGGSPIGMAKAVSRACAERGAGGQGPKGTPPVPIVAIPTTYAGSEMTPVFGVTRREGGVTRKVTVTDPAILPALVIYDPRLALDLPPELTASTGMNALAHCVEAVYSITRNPLSTAAALAGARRIARALPQCHARPNDLEARSEMLAGAYLAGTALANVAMGLHHGLCHVLGGRLGVPHGIANAILLPHVMRFNADVTAKELAPLASEMGVERDGRDDEALAMAAAQYVLEMTGAMRLPQHLAQAGVPQSELAPVALEAASSRTVKNNPKPVDAEQIAAILHAAW